MRGYLKVLIFGIRRTGRIITIKCGCAPYIKINNFISNGVVYPRRKIEFRFKEVEVKTTISGDQLLIPEWTSNILGVKNPTVAVSFIRNIKLY